MRYLPCALVLALLLAGCGREVKIYDEAAEYEEPTTAHNLWLADASANLDLEANRDTPDHPDYLDFERDALRSIDSEADLKHEIRDDAWSEKLDELDRALDRAQDHLPRGTRSAKERYFERGQYTASVPSFAQCDRCRGRTPVCEKCNNTGVMLTPGSASVEETVLEARRKVENMLHGGFGAERE